jgi:hypothetical protein
MQQLSINIRVGIVGDYFIGPYAFLHELSSAAYLHFQNTLSQSFRTLSH